LCRAARVARPHRQCRRRIARREDALEDRTAVFGLAEVSSGRHDDDPGVDRVLHRLAQRIVTIAFEHWMPQR
jgi:hypothetical protein